MLWKNDVDVFKAIVENLTRVLVQWSHNFELMKINVI